MEFILLTAIPIFLYFKNEFILLAFLKLRKQDFEGAKNGCISLKPRNCLSEKQQGYFNYLHGIMQTNNINQQKNISKKQ
jgi:hypothetical protein